jgi:hypothetical protein
VTVPLVYHYSAARTAREVEAASYSPLPKDHEPLNEVLLKQQLAAAKRRVNAEGKNRPVPPPAANLATNPDQSADAGEEIDPITLSLAVSDTNEVSPNHDPFGNPLDENGNWIGPDPCAGHVKPDFASGEWPSLCADNAVPAENCAAWLELEWSIGNTQLHDGFRFPPGCRP